VPFSNKEGMEFHMRKISKATPSGRQSVVIIDGAGWHTENVVDEFNNVSIIKLPAYSPELNPIEQVWQRLRQN